MRVRFWAAFATLFRSNAILRDRAALLSNIGRSISGVYRLNHQAIVIPRSLACTTGFVQGGHPRFENEMGGQPHPAVVKQQQENKVVEPHFITKDVLRWVQLVLNGYAKSAGGGNQLVPREGSKESQAVNVAMITDRAVLSHDFTRNPSDPIYCYGNKAALGLSITGYVPVMCYEIGK